LRCFCNTGRVAIDLSKWEYGRRRGLPFWAALDAIGYGVRLARPALEEKTMRVEIARHALDRVPLSIIFDDSTLLVNLNYFFMRDRNLVDGENRRWEDVPVVHPESFTREFAEWCLEHGVKGKYSIVPCPAALGRIDEGLPMFSRAQQEDWLAMCRELITRNFDITPEMITHTVVVDPDTCRPLPGGIWEQYEWQTLPVDEEERVFRYISRAC